MIGRVCLFVALAPVVLLGCASPTPTPTPSAATLSPVATSGAPTATFPTATATASASAQPPSSPPQGSPAIQDFGAATLLFADAFDAADSGWGTGATLGGNVQYVDGALQFDNVADGSSVWSDRPLESDQNVVHVEANLTPSTGGYQGLLCADGEVQRYGGAASGDGHWVFLVVTADGPQLLSTLGDAAWTIPVGVPTRLALDCAGTATGSFRMQLARPELGLGVIYEGGSSGPQAFDRVGIYGEATSVGYTLRADDFIAMGSAATEP